jgi:hypothetical protein
MFSEEELQQIEAWLDGMLTDEALSAFEANRRLDPAFAAEIALHQALRQAAREKNLGTFRQNIDALLTANTISAVPAPQKNISLPRLLLAIAAMLLLVLAAIWFFRPQQSDLKPLYAEAFETPAWFYNPSAPMATTRDTAGQTNKQWIALNRAWTAQQLQTALQTALEIARTDTLSTQQRQAAYFAAGVIALSQQQPEQALRFFDQAQSNLLFAEDIAWYSALAHLQISFQNPAHQSQALEAFHNISQGPQPEKRRKCTEKILEALVENKK